MVQKYYYFQTLGTCKLFRCRQSPMVDSVVLGLNTLLYSVLRHSWCNRLVQGWKHHLSIQICQPEREPIILTLWKKEELLILQNTKIHAKAYMIINTYPTATFVLKMVSAFTSAAYVQFRLYLYQESKHYDLILLGSDFSLWNCLIWFHIVLQYRLPKNISERERKRQKSWLGKGSRIYHVYLPWSCDTKSTMCKRKRQLMAQQDQTLLLTCL